MSGVNFWNVALTPSEIQNAMSNGLSGNEAGLVSYYPMTAATISGAMLLDASPNHNNGSLSSYGPLAVSGSTPKFASNLNFDGNTSYVQLPFTGLSNFTSGFSFGVWAYASQINSNERLFEIGNGAASDNILLLRNGSSNDLLFYVFNGASAYSLNASNVLVLNTWQYLSVTQTAAGVVTIYVNGISVATSTLPIPNNITRTSNYIGKSNWADPYYAGQMSAASFWNVALSPTQIQNAMNNGLTGNEAGLVSYYPMTTATISATTLFDSSPNHANATINVGAVLQTNPTPPFSSSLTLNGQNAYVQLPATGFSNYTNGFSAGIWVNPSTIGNNQVLFDLGNDAGTDNITLERSGTSNDLNFFVYSNGNRTVVTAPTVLQLNIWQYFSVVQQPNGSVTIYKNGVAVATGTDNVPRNINRALNYIGKSNWSGDALFTGQMSSLSVWNTPLTISQIRSAMSNGMTGSEAGLVAYYPMTPDSISVNLLLDSSPNHLNGILNLGVTILSNPVAPYATAISLKGQNDYVRLPAFELANFTNGFSFGVWFNASAVGNSQRIIDIGNGANSDNIILLRNGISNDLVFYIFKGGSAYSLNAPNVLIMNQWQYLAVTQNSAGVVTIYQNGIAVATSTTIPLANNINRTINYLGNSNWNDGFSPAQMAGASIWNIGLTPAQVLSAMTNGLTGNESGLVGYWPLNETSGSMIHDLSPNQLNASWNGGVITGQPFWAAAPAGTTVAVNSLGNNLISNHAGSTGWTGSDILDVNPQLGPLQFNGGSTPTMAFVAGGSTYPVSYAGTLPGLIHAYTGEGSATDSVGGQTGVWEGGNPAYAPGPFGQAFSFNGANYVQLPKDTLPMPASGSTYAPQPLTTSLWFQTTGGGVILDQLGYTGGWAPLLYVGTDGHLYASLLHSSHGQVRSPGLVNDGAYHNVIVSYDGTIQTVYLDGIAIGQVLNQVSAFNADYYYLFGNGYTLSWPGGNGGWYYFTGRIADFSVFNRALSSADVQTFMQTGLPRTLPTYSDNSPAIGAGQTSTGVVDIGAYQEPISGTGTSVAALQGVAFNGPVATFTDSDASLVPSTLTAVVNWGDGSAPTTLTLNASTAGQIVAQGSTYVVNGIHTYVGPGTYALSILISDGDHNQLFLRSTNITPGLVGSWQGNGNTLDSANADNGTLVNGVTYGPGIGNTQSFSFNGVNQAVDLGTSSNFTLTANGSIEAWIYPTGNGLNPNGQGGIILAKEGEYLLARFGDGSIRYEFAGTSPGLTWVNSGYVAPVNTWTHLVITYNNGNVLLYANGALVATSAGTGPIGDTDVVHNDLEIGGRQASLQPFQGRIEGVNLYNMTLTGPQVLAAYQVLSANANLIGWYQGSGSTIDSTGQNPAGTIVANVGYTTGVGGGAYSFDGSGGSWVALGTSPDVTGLGAFTVSSWVKTYFGGAILAQRDGSNYNGGFLVYVDQSSGKVIWLTQNAGFNFTSTRAINDGQWHQVVVGRDANGTGLIYIDGVLDASQSSQPQNMSSGFNVYIGANPRDNNVYFNGDISAVKIYNGGLSSAQIQSDYQKYAATNSDLVGSWQADGNTNDSTGVNPPGVLVGPVTYGPSLTGGSGQSFSFTGNNGYVQLSNTVGNVGFNDFSAGAWIQTTSTSPSEVIVGKRDSLGNGSFWMIALNAGRPQFELDQDGNGSNYSTSTSPTAVNDGKAHFLMLVRHGATATLYVDGTAVASSTTGGSTYLSNGAPLTIGARRPDVLPALYSFNGSIDNVAFYNKALSTAEVLAAYNGPTTVVGLSAGINVVAPLTVNTTSDLLNPGAGLLSLRGAIALAEASKGYQTIQFSPSLNGQTITLTSTLLVTGNINVAGPGANNLTISGNNVFFGTFGLVNVGPGATATFSGLTFANGYANWGGAFENQSILILNNDVVTGNVATGGDGGAINDERYSQLIATNTVFSNNSTNVHGGAIIVQLYGSASFAGDTFTGNSAGGVGGAIYAQGNLTIGNTTFAQNKAGDRGGALYFDNGGNILIDHATFASNTAPNFGGAIDSEGNVVSINNSTFTTNSVTSRHGGAILNNSGVITINNSSFTGNSEAQVGGAIWNNAGGTLTVNNSVLSGNTSGASGGSIFNDTNTGLYLTNDTISGNSGSDGGGIYVYSSLLKMTGTTVDSNSSRGQGGGLMLNGSTVSLDHSTISNNLATLNGGINGGGIAIYSSNVTISNSTIAKNQANNGGGLLVSGSNVTIANDTIAYNTAKTIGGGINNLNNTSTITMVNTIVADNTAATSPDYQGNINSLGSNVVANSSGYFDTNPDSDGSDYLDMDPMLGLLANNGGPTQTILPLLNSPALQAGDPTNGGLVLTGVTQSTFVNSPGLNQPYYMAFGPDGNLYVANNINGGYISRITPSGRISTFVDNTHGLRNPNAIVFDRSGNLYVSSTGTNTIFKVSSAGIVTTFVSGNGLNGPIGMAFDALGNLFVANHFSNSVLKISPTGAVSTFAAGFDRIYGVAVDSKNNLYVADFDRGIVNKVNPAGKVTIFASGLNHPHGITFDSSGNLWIALWGSNQIAQASPTGVLTYISAAGSAPVATGLAVNAAGSVFVTNSAATSIMEFRNAPSDQRGYARTVLGLIDIGAVENQDTTGDTVRGPLAGATVFYDTNGNGVIDSGEPSTVTAADGSYTLSVPPDLMNALGQYVVIGGTDTSTGLPNIIPMTAPSDFAVVDPFTTLINDLIRNDDLTELFAKRLVASIFGIPSGIDLGQYDPIAQIQKGDTRGPGVLRSEIKLDQTIYMIANLFSGVSGAPSVATLGGIVYNQLASMVANSANPLDLSTSSVLASLIANVSKATGLELTAAIASGSSDLIAGVNSALDTLKVTGDPNSLIPVVQTQVVSEGTIAAKLARLAAGSESLDTVIAAHTGQMLQAEIAAAQVGTIIPQTVIISDVSRQASLDGTTTYTFKVKLLVVPALGTAVSVQYNTEDGTATAAQGDYTATSGTLTWNPGDSGEKTITVTVGVASGIDPSKLFSVVLSHAHGVRIAKAVGVGAIISPSHPTSLVLSESSPSTTFGQHVTFSAIVSSDTSSGIPTGTVTFRANGLFLGTAILNGGGIATLADITLPVGDYTITAKLNSSDLFDSSSASVAETIVFATPILVVSPLVIDYGSYAHPYSIEVMGVGGADLGAATITYGGDGSVPTEP